MEPQMPGREAPDSPPVERPAPAREPETRRRRRGLRFGLTFIEILVVMIILALIAGIVGSQLIGEAEEAKVKTTRIQIQSLMETLDHYRLDNSTYPTTEQGLQALVTEPEVGNIPRGWQGPYMRRVPQDGWGQDFVYQSDGRNYTITSLGADGVEGGSELNADISSNDL